MSVNLSTVSPKPSLSFFFNAPNVRVDRIDMTGVGDTRAGREGGTDYELHGLFENAFWIVLNVRVFLARFIHTVWFVAWRCFFGQAFVEEKGTRFSRRGMIVTVVVRAIYRTPPWTDFSMLEARRVPVLKRLALERSRR